MMVMLLGITLSAKAVTFLYGPYLQAVTEERATIVWVTDTEANAWVEVAAEGEQPKSYFESELGHKVCGRVHRITVPHLKAGVKYTYKIFSQEVDASRRPVGEPIMLDKAASGRPLTLTANNANKAKVKFTVVNDIHSKNAVLESFVSEGVERGNDFMIYNGDMVSHMNAERELFGGFITTSVNIFASEIPFYMCRGNHESRGSFAHNYLRYFPTITGHTYYAFRHGPVFCILLDSGEDKPDTDIAYYDTALFDDFRQREAEWLKGVVASEEFKAAPFRVVFIHQPLNHSWHGGTHSRECFMPILNDADIDLCISAHTHRHSYVQPNEIGNKFPILVNSNVNAITVEADAATMTAVVKNQDGEVVRSESYGID